MPHAVMLSPDNPIVVFYALRDRSYEWPRVPEIRVNEDRYWAPHEDQAGSADELFVI